MNSFTAHLLRFQGKVTSPILLNEHKGSALRGAFFHTLRDRFCLKREQPSCQPCPLHASCPICALVATVDEESPRGVDVPRPFVIDPPLEPQIRYAPGEPIAFGLTIFSQALQLFPYAIIAFHKMRQTGIGQKIPGDDGRWRRGCFVLERIEAINPLTGERHLVYGGADELVHVPDCPVRHEHVLSWVADHLKTAGSTEGSLTITIQLLTPLRLIESGQLVRPLRFVPFIQRLFERLSSLTAHYAQEKLDLNFASLLEQAQAVKVVEDKTDWVELQSYSTRQGRSMPIGGCIGQITFTNQLTPFLPYLVWGQFTHVGKDATKGNGWYTIVTRP
ncbi:MAG: CRISPR system precrRNA processing endoribonuclease RAMP protein Cas6 [Chloroflexi bacterium]|nr:CRISPR system precrRNA processing endoribonuclease RAMP protein Cas6 [Chloroflexota bacterium]MCL5075964.1 CRISPR system precrRNA processing endoribonuclease RAMP protein Cas6 [Chloroflexota bacterium]